MSHHERRARLKSLVEEGGLVVPGAANALTARQIQEAGYGAVYVTGAGLANTHYALPDIGFVSLDLLAQTVQAIRHAVDIPIIVDADTGFGNAVTANRVATVLESVGADAIQLEDQTFPKKCGHFDDKEVISAAEHEMKVSAARDALEGTGALLIARTDARATHGLDHAIERAHAYAAAGADIAFIEGPQSAQEIAEMAQRGPQHQVINIVEGGRTPLLSVDELTASGFSIILFANLCLQASARGIQEALTRLREHGEIEALSELLIPWSQRQALVRKPEYDAKSDRYAHS